MTRFDYVLPTDIGTLEGAVEDAVNLLSIFSEWFEESHKVMQLDRSHTADTPPTILRRSGQTHRSMILCSALFSSTSPTCRKP